MTACRTRDHRRAHHVVHPRILPAPGPRDNRMVNVPPSVLELTLVRGQPPANPSRPRGFPCSRGVVPDRYRRAPASHGQAARRSPRPADTMTRSPNGCRRSMRSRRSAAAWTSPPQASGAAAGRGHLLFRLPGRSQDASGVGDLRGCDPGPGGTGCHRARGGCSMTTLPPTCTGS